MVSQCKGEENQARSGELQKSSTVCFGFLGIDFSALIAFLASTLLYCEFIIRNIYLVFIPISGSELLKTLEFPM